MFFQGGILILLLALQDIAGSAGCGFSVTATQDFEHITSPNYPVEIATSNCTWMVNKLPSDASCALLLHFNHFNIKPADNLLIAGKWSYSGGSLSSGTRLWIFGGPSISLHFTSTASTGYEGFDLLYQLSYCPHTCSSLADCPSCVFPTPGAVCLDLDECEQGLDDCPASRSCTNTFDSYHCNCLIGYQGSPCEDVDECETVANPCHGDAVCSNTVGSYTCTCKTGYCGDGFICKLFYQIEIREDPHGKILASELSDADYETCLNLKHPSMMNWVVMKIDMTLWPEEGTETFYIKIRHGKVPTNYKKWLAVYVTVAGVQRKYTEPREVGTTVLKVCTYDADRSDGVTTVLECVCLQECSVIFYFKLDVVKSIRVCEIEVLKEFGN